MKFKQPLIEGVLLKRYKRFLADVQLPGGEIILVTRVGAEAGLRRSLEHWFAPAARKLGWRTEFSFERYAQWAEKTPDIRLVERRSMPPLGHFSLVRFAKAEIAARGFARNGRQARAVN